MEGEEDLQVLFDGLAEFQAFAERLRKHFLDHFGGVSEFGKLIDVRLNKREFIKARNFLL